MDLISLLILLLVFALVCALAYWILVRAILPALPPPFASWVLAVCGLLALLVLIGLVFPNALHVPVVHR